jgi:hypothetical protein
MGQNKQEPWFRWYTKQQEMLSRGKQLFPQPNFQAYRAPTDNDAGFGNWLPKTGTFIGWQHLKGSSLA